MDQDSHAVTVQMQEGDDVHRWMEELAHAGRQLPIRAIEGLRQHRGAATELLIESIRKACEMARSGQRVEGDAHFFALFLLTEFKAKQALPVLLEACSLPGELVDDLFGGAVTEVFARSLATLAGADLDVFDRLIANPEVYEFVRWQAADVYRYLVRDADISLETAVDRLRGQMRRAIERSDDEIAGPLVCAMSDLFPFDQQQEVFDAEISDLYRRGLADPGLINLDDVRREMRRMPKDRFKTLGPTNIDDTIAELSRWAAFKPEPPKPKRDSMQATAHQHWREELDWDDEPSEEPSPVGTIVSDRPHIGRNDPCPCGSGKKFKKCCGSPNQAR